MRGDADRSLAQRGRAKVVEGGRCGEIRGDADAGRCGEMRGEGTPIEVTVMALQ